MISDVDVEAEDAVGVDMQSVSGADEGEHAEASDVDVDDEGDVVELHAGVGRGCVGAVGVGGAGHGEEAAVGDGWVEAVEGGEGRVVGLADASPEVVGGHGLAPGLGDAGGKCKCVGIKVVGEEYNDLPWWRARYFVHDHLHVFFV